MCNWETLYTVLHGEGPDVSHLWVLGCCAYVHIPKETWVDTLSPKSELMVYLGHTEGIKASTYMQLSNNTMYTSATTIFDETLFSKCEKSQPQGTTHLNKPKAQKLPKAIQNTTSDDFDDLMPPFEIKREVLASDEAQDAAMWQAWTDPSAKCIC